MMLLLGAVLLAGYLVLAVAVARFCAVNRDWEEAIDQIPDDLPFVETRAARLERKPAVLEA